METVFLKLTPRIMGDSRKGAASPDTLFPKIVDVFGARRLAWGSNFPTSPGTLAEIKATAEDRLKTVSADDRDWIFGATEAVVVPATFRWLRDNVAQAESGTALGIYLFGTKIGPAIGAPIAAWLIAGAGWQAMFLLTGLAGLLWLVPWLLVVRGDLPPWGKRMAAERRASAMPASRLLASPLVWGTMLVNFCYNYFTFYCMTWMPAYLVERRHLSLERMGLYSFFSFAGIAIVALGTGWAADRMIARGQDAVRVRKAFTITGFLLASTVVLGAHAASLDAALFWNVASLSGLGLATANNLALCRLTLIPAPAVGLVTGFQQVATSLAGIVAPILSGWLLHASGGYELPIDVIFVVLVVGALTTGLVLRPEWAPVVDPAAPGRC